MSQQRILIGAVAVFAVGALAVAGVWTWVLGPTLAPSGEITAVPLQVTVEAAETLPAPQIVTVEAAAPATTEAVVAVDTAAPEPTEAAASLTVAQISQDESEVRFILSEVLRGQPTTVVGASNQVAGEIAFDLSDLSNTQVGVIQVNARSLATDSEQRNRAIRNRILNTDSYEFITFTPTQVLGLAGSAAPGDTLTFQIEGDLTIRDVTQPAVFNVTATLDEAGQVTGTAETTVMRSDFGLQIPSVPFVADVSEEVQLQIDFVTSEA